MRDAEMRTDANDGVRHLRYLTPGSPTSSRSVVADLFDRDEILLGDGDFFLKTQDVDIDTDGMPLIRVIEAVAEQVLG